MSNGKELSKKESITALIAFISVIVAIITTIGLIIFMNIPYKLNVVNKNGSDAEKVILRIEGNNGQYELTGDEKNTFCNKLANLKVYRTFNRKEVDPVYTITVEKVDGSKIVVSDRNIFYYDQEGNLTKKTFIRVNDNYYNLFNL